jgi:hypothetical protein
VEPKTIVPYQLVQLAEIRSELDAMQAAGRCILDRIQFESEALKALEFIEEVITTDLIDDLGAACDVIDSFNGAITELFDRVTQSKIDVDPV